MNHHLSKNSLSFPLPWFWLLFLWVSFCSCWLTSVGLDGELLVHCHQFHFFFCRINCLWVMQDIVWNKMWIYWFWYEWFMVDVLFESEKLVDLYSWYSVSYSWSEWVIEIVFVWLINDEIRLNCVIFFCISRSDEIILAQTRIKWKDGVLSDPFSPERERISLRRKWGKFWGCSRVYFCSSKMIFAWERTILTQVSKFSLKPIKEYLNT